MVPNTYYMRPCWGIGTVYRATYTRIGRAVYIQAYFSISGTGNSAALYFGGLPWDNAGNGYTTGAADFGKGAKKGTYIRTRSGTNQVEFFYSSEDTSTDRHYIRGTDVGAGYVIFSFHYFI